MLNNYQPKNYLKIAINNRMKCNDKIPLDLNSALKNDLKF